MMTLITDAAAEVSVSRSQVLAWVTGGHVAAVKDGRRRWDVDMDSLHGRLARSDLLAKRLTDLGGARWRQHTYFRVYLHDVTPYNRSVDALAWAGLTFERTERGQPTQAFLDGVPVFDVNGRCDRLYTAVHHIYINVLDETLRVRHREAEAVDYYTADGVHGSLDLLARIIAAVTEHTGLPAGEPFKVVEGHAVPLTIPETYLEEPC